MKIDFNNTRRQLAFAYERLVKKLNAGIENDKVSIFVDDIEQDLGEIRSLVGAIAGSYIEGCPDVRDLSEEIGKLVIFNNQEDDEEELEDPFAHPGPAYAHAAVTILRAIDQDISEGNIPVTVSSISEINNYVNTDKYLALIFPNGETDSNAGHAEAIRELVNSRIASGALQRR